jgi:hypothetical protein
MANAPMEKAEMVKIVPPDVDSILKFYPSFIIPHCKQRGFAT